MSEAGSESPSPGDPPSQGAPAGDVKMEDALEDAPEAAAKEMKLEEELFATDSEDDLPDAKAPDTPASSSEELKSQQPAS